MDRKQWQVRVSALLIAMVALVTLAACTIQTDKGKGKDNVEINTPMGNLNVRANDKQPPDTGLAVYPGAKIKPKDNDDDKHSADVNISSPFFGLKVTAVTYTTNDPQAKVADFYKNDLKKYGSVIECHGDISERKGTDDLYCRDSSSSNRLELGVGTKQRRRVVAIKPNGDGTEFSLVYVEIRGKEGA